MPALRLARASKGQQHLIPVLHLQGDQAATANLTPANQLFVYIFPSAHVKSPNTCTYKEIRLQLLILHQQINQLFIYLPICIHVKWCDNSYSLRKLVMHARGSCFGGQVCVGSREATLTSLPSLLAIVGTASFGPLGSVLLWLVAP